MNPYHQLEKNITAIEKSIGYHFSDPQHLIRAFVHSSFINEYKELSLKHNERLEFLGDSVLNLIITEYLFRNFPDITEGELSSLRSHIVAAPSCTKFITKLGVEQYVLVGRGEQMNASRGKTSIMADLFEAILGAIYLDGGLEKTRIFFFSHFADIVQMMLQKPQANFKALLQEYLQKTKRQIPQYLVLDETGPDHEKQFKVGVCIGDELIGEGYGTSKKEAEQLAAKFALLKLSPQILQEPFSS
jgi:ribonuclease III